MESNSRVCPIKLYKKKTELNPTKMTLKDIRECLEFYNLQGPTKPLGKRKRLTKDDYVTYISENICEIGSENRRRICIRVSTGRKVWVHGFDIIEGSRHHHPLANSLITNMYQKQKLSFGTDMFVDGSKGYGLGEYVRELCIGKVFSIDPENKRYLYFKDYKIVYSNLIGILNYLEAQEAYVKMKMIWERSGNLKPMNLPTDILVHSIHTYCESCTYFRRNIVSVL